MTTTTSTRRQARRIAVMTTAIGPVSATLTITPFDEGRQTVLVTGRIGMTRAEAQALIDSGHKVALRLWGEDVASEDLIIAPCNSALVATSAGLEFRRVWPCVKNSGLDEDGGASEPRVGVRVVDLRNATVRSPLT